jgi:hypothetical protein
MKISTTILFIIAILFVQCDRNVDLEICPDVEGHDWFEDLKDQYPTNSDTKVEIYSYLYNNMTAIAVNTVEPTCCDFMDVVYDCSGNVICQFGGIAGLNTCPDFADTATDKKLIFKN